MKPFYLFFDIVFCLFLTNIAQAQTWSSAGCDALSPDILLTMIDACGAGTNTEEPSSEYFMFHTNDAPFDANVGIGVQVECPLGTINADYLGAIGNPTAVANLNALVGSCATPVFIDAMSPPTNGIIPPNAVVWAFNTDHPNLSFFDSATFATLCGAYPIYVTFGTYGGSQPMFKNQGSCTACGCIRYVTLTLGNCTYSYSYDIQNLVDANGDNNTQDGAFITLNDDQSIGYGNNQADCFPIAEFCTPPDNPIVSNPTVSICANQALPTFVCVNCNDASLWFDQAVGGIPIADGPTFSPLTANSSSFWVQNIGNGCVSERIEIVFEVQNPPVALFSPDITTLCQNIGTQFSVSFPQNGVDYTWTLTTPDNNNSVGNGTTYDFVGNMVGNYSLQLSASSGNCSDTYTETFSILAPPVALISPSPTQFCENDNISLSYGGATNDPNTVYIWQINDLDSGEMTQMEGENIVLNNIAAGNYSASLQFFLPDGCESSFANLAFNVSENANISTSTNCISPIAFELSLDITGGTMPYTVNGELLTGNSNTYTFPENTNYALIITDNSTCPQQLVTGTASCNCPPLIAPQLNTYLLEACDNVALSPLTVQNPQNGYQYVWYNVGGVVPLLTNSTTFLPSQTGDYFVVAVDVFDCPSETVAFSVNLLPAPEAPPSINQTYCTTDAIGVLFDAPIGTTVIWDCIACTDDGQGTQFAPTANAIGNYQYNLYTQNQGACQSSSSLVNIEIEDCTLLCPNITNIAAPANLCSGETANLVVNINDPAGTLDHIAWFDAVGNLLSNGLSLQTSAEVLGCNPLVETYVAQVFCTANPANPSDSETAQITFHPAAAGNISIFNAGCSITATPLCPNFSVSPAEAITTTIDGDNSSHSFTIHNAEAEALGLSCATTSLSGNLDCSMQCFQVFILANGNVETCHGISPNLSAIQNTIFISDPATFAGVAWFEDVALSIPISNNTFAHSGANPCTTEIRTIYAGALCSENINAPIYAGTVQVTIFPPFNSTFLQSTAGSCGIVPSLQSTCSNYILAPNLPSIPNSVDPGDSGNATWFVRYNDGPNNNSCFNQSFSVPYNCDAICPQVSVEQSSPATACSGDQFTLSAQVSPPTAILGVDYSIQWLRNGAPILGANQLTYNATAISGSCDSSTVIYSLGYSCINPGQLTETYPAGNTETPPSYNPDNIATSNINCQVPTAISLCGAYTLTPVSVPNAVGQGDSGTATWQVSTTDNCFSQTVSVNYNCPLLCPVVTTPLNATTKICSSTTLNNADLAAWTNNIGYTNATNANGFLWFADAAFSQALTPSAYAHTDPCSAQVFTVYVALQCIDNSLIAAGTLQITSYPTPNNLIPIGGCSLEVQSNCGNSLVIEYQTAPNTWSSAPPSNPTTGQNLIWRAYVAGSDIDNDNTPDCLVSSNVTAVACECIPPAAATSILTSLNVCEGNTNNTPFSITIPANAFAVWYNASGDSIATGNSFIPTQVGNYTVQTFSITDTCAGGNIPATLTQTALPNATFSYPQSSYCSSNNTVLASTNTSGGTFTADNGLVINANTGEIALTTAGNYSITYSIGTTCPNSSTQSIIIDQSPTLPNLNNPNLSICANDTNSDAWELSIPNGFSTTWYDDNNNLIGNQNSFTATASGNYTYQIANSNNLSCVVSGNVSLSINPNDIADISYPNTAFCWGENVVTASINGTTGGQFVAEGIDVNPNTGAFSPNVVGDFNIYYTTNGLCPATDSVIISVSNTPLVVEAGADTILCLGDNIDLSATMQGSGTVVWTGDHLSSFNSLSPNFSATEIGTFLLQLHAENECQTANDSLEITVLPLSILTVSGNTNIVAGNSTLLEVSGGTNYTWTPPTELSCADCANPIATPTTTTNYTITTDALCSEPLSITIQVTNPPPPSPPAYIMLMPNAFSPNGDNQNDELRPSSSETTFDYYHFVIYDRWGQKRYETNQAFAAWDGTYKGFPEEMGVYVYYLEYAFVGKRHELLKGNITLLR